MKKYKGITNQLKNIGSRYGVIPGYETEIIQEKNKILDFMKKPSRRDGIYAGIFYDTITDKRIDQVVYSYMYEDFIWDDMDIYYFEKYDIKLNPEFLKIATNI